MNKRHHLLELALWSALWLAYVPLTRAMQPSLLMTMLAVAVLLAAAAGLLRLGRAVNGSSRPPAHRLALLALATLGAGTAAAVAIRLLYLGLAPEVRPFGMAFNIAADSAWAAVHALAVGRLLARLARKSPNDAA